MTGLIVDASVVLAWLLPGEANSIEATALADQVAEQGAAVPSIWRLEVGNALLAAERRGRISAIQVEAACQTLADLPVEIDLETSAKAWTITAKVARRHGLTLYDAAYLELAIRRGLALATFDRALARAAVAEEVALATAVS